MLTVTLPIGIAVSLALVEITGLSAGGIISPAYVALVLDDPIALSVLAVATLLAYATVGLLARRLFLYGSRRFSVTVLAGATFSVSVNALLETGLVPGAAAMTGELALFGYVVPGLIAHQCVRQGVLPTIVMLAIAAPLVRTVALLLGAV